MIPFTRAARKCIAFATALSLLASPAAWGQYVYRMPVGQAGKASTGPVVASPTAVAFRDVAAGSSTGEQITLSNRGANDIELLAVEVSSTAFSTRSIDCAAVLPAQSDCHIEVQFHGGAGQHVANVAVTTSQGRLQIPVSASTFTGVGELLASPNTITFGDIEVGTAASPISVLLRNVGTAPVSGIEVAAQAPTAMFRADAAACDALAAGEACSLSLEYLPTAPGEHVAQFLVSSEGAAEPAVLSVAGRGVAASVQLVENTAGALRVLKGGPAATGRVTYANVGTAPTKLTFSGVSAPFSLSSTDCDIPAGESCSVAITLEPTGDIGTQPSATLVANGAPGGSIAAPVAGLVQGARVTVVDHQATRIVTWKDGQPGTGTITLANAGNITANATFSLPDSPYSLSTDACDIEPGASCTITVAMANDQPLGDAPAVSMRVTGDAFGPQDVLIGGFTVASEVVVESSTTEEISTTYNGGYGVGTVVFRNRGNVPAMVSFQGLEAPFNSSPVNCQMTAGGTCTVSVYLNPQFTPGVQAVGTLTASGGTLGQVDVPVSGMVNGGIITIDSNTATVMSATKGGPRGTGQVVVRNTGNAASTFNLQVLNPQLYAVAPSSCSLQPNEACSATVSFDTSGAVGPQDASGLLITSTNAAGITTLPIRGYLESLDIQVEENTATNLSAEYLAAPAVGRLVLANRGTGRGTVSVAAQPGPFSLSADTCTLGAQETCTISVTMDPNEIGRISRDLTITDEAGTTRTVTVAGTVFGSWAERTSPASVTLQTPEYAGPAKTVIEFRNRGNREMTLAPAPLPVPLSVVQNTCVSIAPNATCSMTVQLDEVLPIGSSSTEQFMVTGAARNAEPAAIQWTVTQTISLYQTAVRNGNTTEYQIWARNNAGRDITLTNISFGPGQACLGSNCFSGDLKPPVVWPAGSTLIIHWDGTTNLSMQSATGSLLTILLMDGSMPSGMGVFPFINSL
ncbi:hypothetical protein D3C71_24210 [compost metagenome]